MKKRAKQYDKPIQLKENIGFDDLIKLSLKDTKKKTPKKKSKKK